ncbi:hypothetical protein DFA_05134 [Cavenderia fasciculata]|uniref:Uncharacterized protein n=1 Tax=Cavenderia fasciculata TaxID=261658 RepID=F4PNF1_CACFS|nr:uncharacterized protein DFA_05134 [Cavenderia fasciculata]EGG23004.1 hypothetical protein DFA_05134 [Cavenderia fasciculata]|eukprot:XP_004360855.1 hypothetical protein DFA_05134 [Cavenderia fasciculata]
MTTSFQHSTTHDRQVLLSVESISIVVTFAEYLDALFKASLDSPLYFSLRSNGNTRISCQEDSSMECIQRRADQVILHISYSACNLKYNASNDDNGDDDDDDLIYDKDKCCRPSQALHYLLLIKSPDGTDNDMCLLPYLSHETKKHIHELLLNHIKQLKQVEYTNYEMELIQLIISNQYNNDKDIYLFIIQTFNWFNVWFNEMLDNGWAIYAQYPMIQIMMIGILKLNDHHYYDAHISDKYLDVIYDTLDTVFRVYEHRKIFWADFTSDPIYIFLLLLKQYSFQDQRGKDLKRRISEKIFSGLSDDKGSIWNSQIGCDFFKDYITKVFLDAHNDHYFIPQQPSDYMDAKDWEKDIYTRVDVKEQIRSFSAYHHPKILLVLFEHFNRCLAQTWKDKLIVLKLLNMFDYINMDYKEGEELLIFSKRMNIIVISETLKEDNLLVQCELLEFINQFYDMPYYCWNIVDSIRFRDIIQEAFNHIINKSSDSSSPHPRLLYFLIKALKPKYCSRPGPQLIRIIPTGPFWQEYIVNITLKSVQSNQKVVIVDGINLFLYDDNPQFISLKALSTTTYALLDRFQIDDDILSGVIRFFNHTLGKLGFKEINQLIQRILFSQQQQQYQPDQIDRFVRIYLVGWIVNSTTNNFSIYLPTVMKRILGQPIDRYNYWIDSLFNLFEKSQQLANRYVQHFIAPTIQSHTTSVDINHKLKTARLLSLLFTRRKGIDHLELFQHLLDIFTAPEFNYSLRSLLRTYLVVITEMIQQIIDTRGEGNITSDQILQIIDLIVRAQQLIYSLGYYFSEVGDLIKLLVSMGDNQCNTIAMISSNVIDVAVDWINQTEELENKALPPIVELVVDFYDQAKLPQIITISPTEKKISSSEWIDRLILPYEKRKKNKYLKEIIAKLKQLKEKIIIN